MMIPYPSPLLHYLHYAACASSSSSCCSQWQCSVSVSARPRCARFAHSFAPTIIDSEDQQYDEYPHPTDRSNNNDESDDGGSYIDLGTVQITPSNDNKAEAGYNEVSILLQNLNDVFNEMKIETLMDHRNINISNNVNISINNHKRQPTPSTNMTEWRSNHWIVLIDDEPSIRLAIGDYLHSMGYTMITACDGPQSFLDVLLYSCGWSVSGAGEYDALPPPPPWMKVNGEDTETSMLWRLPNCIISDIRMPGGVDGVQLLQLLRHVNEDSNSSSSGSTGDDGDDVVKKGKKSKRRPRKDKTSNSSNEYDGKDEFELLDAIVSNNDKSTNTYTGGKQPNFVTAIDQARHKLNVIRDTLAYHQELPKQRTQQQYPTSLLQIPIILLTAKAMVSDRIVGFKAGANNYLPKPFRPEELLGMVDSLLRKQEREKKEGMNDLGGGGGGGGDINDDLFSVKRNNNKEEVVEDPLAMYSASAQQIKDLTTELIEIKKLLKEEAQQKANAKIEQEEIGRLTKLLPDALWMFMNNERRKRLFTSDHIRSILLFCFEDVSSLARKSTAKRDELLAELERMDDENPDILTNFLVD